MYNSGYYVHIHVDIDVSVYMYVLYCAPNLTPLAPCPQRLYPLCTCIVRCNAYIPIPIWSCITQPITITGRERSIYETLAQMADTVLRAGSLVFIPTGRRNQEVQVQVNDRV